MEQQQPTIRVLGFKTEYRRNKKTSEAEAIDWVEYAPIHSIMNTRVWSRVKDMQPPEQPFENDDEGMRMAFLRHRWEMVEKAYAAWKNDEEMPVDGTPLAMWPAINSDQAEQFRKFGIRTIEEVATLTDAVITKIPLPNLRTLKASAAAFLEASDRSAVADEMASQREQIADLQQQLADAMELIKAGAESAPAKPKQSRGRKSAGNDVTDTAEAVSETEAQAA